MFSARFWQSDFIFVSEHVSLLCVRTVVTPLKENRVTACRAGLRWLRGGKQWLEFRKPRPPGWTVRRWDLFPGHQLVRDFFFCFLWCDYFLLSWEAPILSQTVQNTLVIRGETWGRTQVRRQTGHTHTCLGSNWGKPGALFSTSSQCSFLAAHGHLWGAFINTLRPGFQPILSTEVWFKHAAKVENHCNHFVKKSNL